MLVDANWRVCVADFGLAITAKKSAASNGEQLGTIGYMAPEIALQTSEFTYAADVYSFAICLWEIFTGMEPYANEDWYAIIRQLQDKERLPLPPEEIWPKELADLVSKCWAEAPSDRPSFEEIIITLRQLEKIGIVL